MSIVVMFAVLILGWIFSSLREEQRTETTQPIVMSPEQRAERLDTAYLTFKTKLEEHMALPKTDQKSWVIKFIQDKIREIEAEALLNLRR